MKMFDSFPTYNLKYTGKHVHPIANNKNILFKDNMDNINTSQSVA